VCSRKDICDILLFYFPLPFYLQLKLIHQDMGMKNQSKEEIYTTILENIRNINNVPLVTRIMYVSLHSHKQLKGYLAHMIENDLLKYDGQKHVYEVTSKGKQFLLLSNHLSQLLCVLRSMVDL